MLQYILLIVLAYLGYRYFNWQGAVAVVVLWFVLGYVYRMLQARASTRAAVQVISSPLSADEKLQMNVQHDHNQKMAERAARNKIG
jgi:uncharacterized membrane-anchored protein YitT (DUF2179 family)